MTLAATIEKGVIRHTEADLRYVGADERDTEPTDLAEWNEAWAEQRRAPEKGR